MTSAGDGERTDAPDVSVRNEVCLGVSEAPAWYGECLDTSDTALCLDCLTSLSMAVSCCSSAKSVGCPNAAEKSDLTDPAGCTEGDLAVKTLCSDSFVCCDTFEINGDVSGSPDAAEESACTEAVMYDGSICGCCDTKERCTEPPGYEAVGEPALES